jgi:hypothetical protein
MNSIQPMKRKFNFKKPEVETERKETDQKETDQKETETDQKETETDQKETETDQKETETDQKETETDQKETETDQKEQKEIVESIRMTEKIDTLHLSDEIRVSLTNHFKKCVQGYHLIHDDPIKESRWEDVNAIILEASGCSVYSQSNGSHQSGADISCSLGEFSNKSTQYDKPSYIKISSYRLTTVCSNKTHGDIETIIKEINRRKNFTFYSILVRKESANGMLYDWYLIPSNHPVLDPSTYEWKLKSGKTGITGWETNTINGSSMSINFSMSSQLWISVHITEDMKKYIVGSVTTRRGRKYNYISLYELDHSFQH